MSIIRNRLLLSVFAAICLLVVLSGAVQRQIKRDTLASVEGSLITVLKTGEQALSTWIDEQKASATIWAKRPQTRLLTESLLQSGFSQAALIDVPAQKETRSWFGSVTSEREFLGYFIIAPGNINISSSRDANLGVESFLTQQPQFLARLWSGEAAVSLPLRSDVPLPGPAGESIAEYPTMFVGAPIMGEQGKPIALFLFRIDPQADFTAILQRGRLGTTGETYAFDRQGLLMSESRFNDQLREIGLLTAGRGSMLNIQLRDPGVDLTRGGQPSRPLEELPLTRMADSAVRGMDAVETNPYRDYRGVPVVGAWLWEESLGLGIATEIDAAAAFQVLVKTRMVISLLTAGAGLLIILLAGFFARSRHLALRMNMELEAHVAARTAELAGSRERFALAVRGSGDGLWDYDLGSGHVWYSDRFMELLGYDVGEFGKTLSAWQELLHPEDRVITISAFQSLLEGREDHYAEYRLRCKSGEYRWFRAKGQALKDGNGRVYRVAGSISDTTERRQAMEEIRKLSRATDESPAFVLITRRDGTIEYVNARFTEITGYEAEEAIGRNPRILKSGMHPPEVYREMWDTILAGRNWYGEVQNRKKNGELYWGRVSISPIRDDAGEITHFVGVQEDITDRKVMEGELVRAKEAAEGASEARSMFLANMSHEIRTPLNGIVGFSRLMQKTELTSQQRDYLRKINISSESLLALINDILDFSKIEAGKLVIEQVDFQLQNVLEELADLFADRAARSNIELIIAREADVPSALLGDPMRLRQVLINLTNNAVKFTEGGEIFVNVQFAGEENDRILLRFSVRDTGIGIPPEKVQTLFDSFTQADGSTTRKYGGTGLGLTISKQLTELMGGRIGVESQVDKGSTFWFEMPFATGAASEEPLHRLHVDLRGLKVLVIDDNAVSREVLGAMLLSFGFEVDSAIDGVEGLDRLRAAAAADAPYRLALVDWRMPKMDGLEASRRIRQIPELADLLIVMVTAFGRDRETQEGAKIGINGFLCKPVQQSVLFDTLMEALGQFEKAGGARHPMVTEESLRAGELAGARVLLAEDNAINQEVAVELLTAEGIKVDIAGDGLEALEMVGRRRYDAVLMDMQMPEMDGYEATRQIRRDPAFAMLPIIAMTAHAMQGDREKCLAVGMNDYVTKPIDPTQLFQALGRWVKPIGNRRADKPTEIFADGSGTVDELGELPGFDVTSALERLRGNRKLYRKLLGDVTRKHAADADEIRAALAAGNLEEACSLTHALKGIAGNLAILALYKAAAQLEKSIVAAGDEGAPDPERLDGHLNNLAETLEQAVATIRAAVDVETETMTPPAAGDTESLDPALADEVARRVLEAARGGDIGAVSEALGRLPEGLPLRAELAGLAAAFDLAGLQEAAGKLLESENRG